MPCHVKVVTCALELNMNICLVSVSHRCNCSANGIVWSWAGQHSHGQCGVCGE